jgi:tetratricopeptide (TPR) repeat protein
VNNKIVTGILLGLFVSFCAKAQTLDEALQYLQKKNYLAAIDICDQLLAKSSGDADVLSVRSLTCTAMGKYDQALQDADNALSKNSNSARAHYAKAEVYYYGQKDYNKALQEYDAAVTADNKMTEAYAGKARSYMSLQNNKEGLRVIESALDAFPNNAELNYVCGLLNFQRGKLQYAVESYDKALSADSKWNPFFVYLNRGLANEALLEYDFAVQDFSKAIAADPNGSAAYIGRGNVYYVMYRYEEAITDFKKAEILNPDNSIITYNIGMAYHRNDDRSSACKYFQKSCAQGNNNACKMMLLNCTDRRL